MYGLWIIVIALFALGLILGITFIILYNIPKKYDDSVPCGVSSIIFIVLAFVVMIPAISSPLNAKSEYLQYKNTKDIVEQAIENGNDFNDIGLTNEIIEINQWVAKVKASKETYGCFSNYYYIDLKDLELIYMHDYS